MDKETIRETVNEEDLDIAQEYKVSKSLLQLQENVTLNSDRVRVGSGLGLGLTLNSDRLPIE